eukprot:m51a1_g9279 putative C-tail anchored protein (784) ;mRNA; r:115709-123576
MCGFGLSWTIAALLAVLFAAQVSSTVPWKCTVTDIKEDWEYTQGTLLSTRTSRSVAHCQAICCSIVACTTWVYKNNANGADDVKQRGQLRGVLLALRVVRHLSDAVTARSRSRSRSRSPGSPANKSPDIPAAGPTPPPADTPAPTAVCEPQPQRRAAAGQLVVAQQQPPPGKRRLAGLVLDGVDLGADAAAFLAQHDCSDAFFVNCTGAVSDAALTAAGGVTLRLDARDLPIKPLRERLYTTEELREVDQAAYLWCRAADGMGASQRGRVAAYLHDGCTLDALVRHVEGHTVVGIMGGHAMKRADPSYAQVAWLCWDLARRGFMVASGGGPGAMEAANLGAFLAGHEAADVRHALAELAAGGNGGHEFEYQNVETSEEVLAKYRRPGDGALSVGVPTWVYGHEPFNRFCGAVAKFVSNAIREDILIAICNGGIVFSPGAAGTRTEIFQFGVPNAYAKETPQSYSKPTIFLGSFWVHCGVFATFLNVAQREDADRARPNGYSKRVYCLESNEEIVAVLEAFRSSPHGAPATPAQRPDAQLVAAVDAAVADAIATGHLRDGSVVGIASGAAPLLALARVAEEAATRGWKVRCVPCSDASFAAIAEARRAHGGAVEQADFPTTPQADVAFCEVCAVDEALNAVPSAAAAEGCVPTERLLLTSSRYVVAVAPPGSARSLRGCDVVLDVIPLAVERVQLSIAMRVPSAQAAVRRLSESALSTPHVTDAGNLELALGSDLLLDACGGDPARVFNMLRAIPGVVDVGLLCGVVSVAIVADGLVTLRPCAK